jgi:hypothetical protein
MGGTNSLGNRIMALTHALRKGMKTWYLLLFFVGAIIHFLLMRHYLSQFNPPASDPGIAKHPLVLVAATAFGGLSFAWFMTRLLRPSTTVPHTTPMRTVLRGALYGALATAVAFQLVSVSISLILAVLSDSWLAPLYFLFSLIGAGTYGLGIVIQSLPVALAYGALMGLAAVWVQQRIALPPGMVETPECLASDSLVLAILGILLALVPFIGVILSVTAIHTARRAVKALPEGCSASRRRAKASIVIGALGLAWFVMSITVFSLAYLGLVR